MIRKPNRAEERQVLMLNNLKKHIFPLCSLTPYVYLPLRGVSIS
jgi:hypothetical protein